MSFISKITFVGLLTAGSASGSASLVALPVITQSVSQLINGISTGLQKLLKCFNGATISTFVSVLLPSNLSVKRLNLQKILKL